MSLRPEPAPADAGVLPWPPLYRLILSLKWGRRRPISALAVLFGGPWSIALALFLSVRWEAIMPSALISYLVGAILWDVAPGFLYLHHSRYLPTFVASAQEAAKDVPEFRSAVARRPTFFRRFQFLIAVPLFLVAISTYWALTPFLFSKGGFAGFSDPFFWVIFGAWMVWFALVALPGLASIAVSLLVVRDLARSGVKLRLFHHDGVGGLGCIGHFVAQSALGVSVACLFLPIVLVAMPASNARLALLIALTVIVGLLVVSLGWPLLEIRRAAEDAKRRELGRLEQEYSKLTSALAVADRSVEAQHGAAMLVNLAQLRLHESGILLEIPTVPISIASWVRVALQAIPPLAFMLIEIGLQTAFPSV